MTLFLGMCALGILFSGANIAWFVSIPSLLMVVAPSLFLSLCSFGFGEIGSYFSAGFSRQVEPKEVLLNALVFFQSLKKYLFVSGIIGTFVGVIAILSTLGDVKTVAFNTGLAVLTVLYAFILYMGLVVPFTAGIRKKIHRQNGGLAKS